MGLSYNMSELRASSEEKSPVEKWAGAESKQSLRDLRDSYQIDLGRKLLNEARQGNAEKVKELVILGAPFTADWVGTSPLHYAAYYNHADVTELLLKSGIAQDARNKVDRTPLHIACQMGYIEIVKLLFAFGADPSVKDMLRMTPLHWAVESGDQDVVRIVLNHGCPVDCVDKFGKTAMDLAEDKGQFGIVQLIQEVLDTPLLAREGTVTQTKLQSLAFGKWIRNKTAKKREGPERLSTGMKKKRIGLILERGAESEKHITINQSQEPSSPIIIKDEPLSPTSNDYPSKTLQLFEEHGIKMIEPDNETVVSSAIESGLSIRLTEAGKLGLISSKPLKTVTIPKPKTIVQIPKSALNSATKTNPSPFKLLTNGKKVIQVTAGELLKMAAEKKFIIKQASPSPTAKLLDGKLYTNLDHYISSLREKKYACDQNVQELRKLLNEKEAELNKIKYLLESAIKEKSESKLV